MKKAAELFMFLAIICWASLIGGVLYSHIAFFPSYLSRLPESSVLVNGAYPVTEEYFWMFMHPLTILSIIVALVLNWKMKARRNYILATASIYALAIVATFFYFVPELIAFSESHKALTMTEAEWYQRGQNWQHLSWVRGGFMYLGFIFLLVALTKRSIEKIIARQPEVRVTTKMNEQTEV